MENLLKNRDFAIFAVDSNNNGTMSYVIKDHQGSMYATVTGNTVERYSFDAWGRRRNPQTLSYDNVTTSFDRGYTLHEHYDDFGLINMNGRLYDALARHSYPRRTELTSLQPVFVLLQQPVEVHRPERVYR